MMGEGHSSSTTEVDSTSAGSDDVSADDTTGSDGSSTGVPEPIVCREFGAQTPILWEHIVELGFDLEVATSASMLTLGDGGLVFQAGDTLRRYDASGAASGVPVPEGTLLGLAPAQVGGEFSVLAYTQGELRLLEYQGNEVLSETSAPLAVPGIPIASSALTHDAGFTVVSQAFESEGRRDSVLQLRNEHLEVEASYADAPFFVPPVSAAVGAPGGEVFIASPGSPMRLDAFDDAERIWTEFVADEEEDYLRVHRMAVGEAIFVAARANSAQSPYLLLSISQDDGTLLWQDPLPVRTVAPSPCGRVIAAAQTESQRRLFFVDLDGPTLATDLEKPTAPQGHYPGNAVMLRIGNDGTLFVARVLPSTGEDESLVSIAAY